SPAKARVCALGSGRIPTAEFVLGGGTNALPASQLSRSTVWSPGPAPVRTYSIPPDPYQTRLQGPDAAPANASSRPKFPMCRQSGVRPDAATGAPCCACAGDDARMTNSTVAKRHGAVDNLYIQTVHCIPVYRLKCSEASDYRGNFQKKSLRTLTCHE